MPDEISISGLDELREVLETRLPEALRGKAMQAALAKAAQPIVAQAKSLAPVRAPRGFVGPLQEGAAKGTLRKSIYSYRNKQSTRTYESRFIGVKRKAWYWRFIEFGRSVVTRDKGSLGTPLKGFFGKSVRAFPAKPFLRPSFEANKYRAIDIVRDELKPAIERVAAKARSRTIRRIVKKFTGN